MTFNVTNTFIPGSAAIASEVNKNFTDIGSELNLQTNKSDAVVELQQHRNFGRNILNSLANLERNGVLTIADIREPSYVYNNRNMLDAFNDAAVFNGSVANSCGSQYNASGTINSIGQESFVYPFDRYLEYYSSGTIVAGGSSFYWKMFTQDWVTSISGIYTAGNAGEVRSSYPGSTIDLRSMPDNTMVIFRDYGATSTIIALTSGVNSTDGAGVQLFSLGQPSTIFLRTVPSEGSVYYSTNGGLIESGVNIAGTLVNGSWYIRYVASAGGGARLSPIYLCSGVATTKTYQSLAYSSSGTSDGNLIIGSVMPIVDDTYNYLKGPGSIAYFFSADSGTTFQNVIPEKVTVLNHSGNMGVFQAKMTTGSQAGSRGFMPPVLRKWMVNIL